MKPDLFSQIESPYFSAQLNVVSGSKQFTKAVESQFEIREFVEMARNDWSNSVQVLARIYELIERKCDADFENPWDVAIAAYLLILQNVRREFAWFAAQRIKSHPKNFWWAAIIAEQIRPEAVGSKPNHATMSRISVDKNLFQVKASPTANHSRIFILYRLTTSESEHGGPRIEQFDGITISEEMRIDPPDLFSPETSKAFRNSGTSNRVTPYFCEVGE